MNSYQSDDVTVDLKALLSYLSRFKYLFLAALVLSFLCVFGYLKLFVPDSYRSSAVVALASPSDSRSGNLPGLGQLGQLAGINVQSSDKLDMVVAVARSRSFFESLLSEKDFEQGIYESLSATRVTEEQLSDADIRRKLAHKYFLDRFAIQPGAQESLVQLSFKHDSNLFSFLVVDRVIKQVNEYMRVRDKEEAGRSMLALEKRVTSVSQPIISEVLYSLIEEKMQVIVLAESTEEYALKIIDPPIIEPIPDGPRRLILALVMALTSTAVLFVGFTCWFLLHEK